MTAQTEASSTPWLKLSEQEIALRKRWLDLAAGDEAIIRDEIDRLICEHVDELMDSMYEHFLAFEDTRSFFPNEQILNRAKSAQKAYFERLTKGNYDEEYVHHRLQVGSTHHRIELDPKWYIGAYNRAFSWMLPKIIAHLSNNPEKLSLSIQALIKIIFFDMGLAIESYIGAKEFAIRKHRDAIRELETEKRVIKSILENAPIGIVSLNENFVCSECNDEFLEILSIKDRKQVIGVSLFTLAPHLDRTAFEGVLKSGQPFRQSAVLLRLTKSERDNETYWDWATWPVKDDSGKIAGLVAMFANATDTVLLQRQREDFVATLTHDLKTPVLATNRAIQLLLDGDFGPLTNSQEEILETVLQSNSALYSLVQTLLEVYRFDSGVKELHMKSSNLAAIITQVVTEIMPLAYEKGVELKATLPGDAQNVTCDEDEIRRVIQNLIDNSLKFTLFGGSITIAMTQTPEKTTISVTDTGRGIPEENKPKLFQRFWQAGPTGRYYASTGLGLYLCRRIIEGHHGRIWFDSSVGQGSVFYFEI